MTEALLPQLVRLARGRITQPAYLKAHRETVGRILVSWSKDPALETHVPRLLHYCLETDGAASALALCTFQHMTGQSSQAEFIKRLRAELAVLDQLSSVPWPYGIRTRCGADTQCLAPLILPGDPIKTGSERKRLFRTTVPGQSHARIELFAGPGTGERTEGCVPLLARRVPLPAGLPAGEQVEVAIQRLAEAGLRLELRIPGCDQEGGPWWRNEDSSGFSDLATAVERRFQELQQDVGAGRGLRVLLKGCLQFLNRSWHLLSEEDADRLVSWVRQASSALERRDEVGLKNAIDLLLGDLDAIKNESKAVILESLLVASASSAAGTRAGGTGSRRRGPKARSSVKPRS